LARERERERERGRGEGERAVKEELSKGRNVKRE